MDEYPETKSGCKGGCGHSSEEIEAAGDGCLIIFMIFVVCSACIGIIGLIF